MYCSEDSGNTKKMDTIRIREEGLPIQAPSSRPAETIGASMLPNSVRAMVATPTYE
jgi:hypothetical protein